jgi:hypothetical protein
MKKYIFHSICFLTLFLTGHMLIAQTSQTIRPNAAINPAQLKSSPLSAYSSITGGNGFTTNITNRVATPLSLTAAQQKSMNTALYNFFNQKGGLNKLKWTDPASYQQQANTLLQTFIGQLGAFLSPDQVSKFVAMKPAGNRSNDPLVSVFY